MKKYKNYLIGLLLFISLCFFYGFAEKRNSSRKIAAIDIKFTNGENLYITESAVNNLLIQNKLEVKKLKKEALDLNKVESLLVKNEMIQSAEVYLTVNANLGAKLVQRQPLARVMDESSFYIDANGSMMPLSSFYSARVPLVKGISKNNIDEVFPLLEFIKKDDFFVKHIIGISRNKQGLYQLEVREMPFSVLFGKPTNMKQKFKNFKAFYQKALKEDKLNLYKTVDLRFGNQVVCTKK